MRTKVHLGLNYGIASCGCIRWPVPLKLLGRQHAQLVIAGCLVLGFLSLKAVSCCFLQALTIAVFKSLCEGGGKNKVNNFLSAVRRFSSCVWGIGDLEKQVFGGFGCGFAPPSCR